MSSEREPLERAIAGLESQRGVLGDATVDAALAPLRSRLAALDPRAHPAQALRQVTILFLDVTGSTALAQHLDAEDMHAVMDGLLARCTTIVAAHRGKVLQYAGDSLLGVFGADAAHEDDAERAVRAGLALLAEGKRSGAQVAQQHGHRGFDIRVGVHTGGVLLGGGVDGEHSIRGHSVHVAARLEQSAPPGGLRISHDTYRQVRGLFDVETQPPLIVKGVDQPLTTYLVRSSKPCALRAAMRGIEGIETRMIGRDAELGQLQQAFENTCRERRLLHLNVVGEAGLGKSRLLHEFEKWVETRPEARVVLRGRAHPHTQVQPYGLLRDMLLAWLQIADNGAAQATRRTFEQGVVSVFEGDRDAETAQAHAHVLGHLLGMDFTDSRHIVGILDDAKQIRNRAFRAAAQLLRRMAERRNTSVLMLLDDLHYADEGSLDLIEYLCHANRDVAMLIVGLTRPALFERRPDRFAAAARALRVDLATLDARVSRSLADELLQKLDPIPAPLRNLVSDGAEGNPFYMEELVKMLIDEGAIVTDTSPWTLLPERLGATRIPPTLTGMLQARLDALKSTEKRALQNASVVGFVFWNGALAAIDPTAPDALASLVQRGLLVQRPGAGPGHAREYAFSHQLLHHVTYETVLKRTRREAHAKAALWFAEQCRSRPHAFLGATAAHYEQAGDRAMACEYFARAAENASQRFGHEAALHCVSKALALVSTRTELDDAQLDGQRDALLRWRVVDARERMLDLLGKRAEQQTDIATLQELADALNDDTRRAEVAWRRCDIALRRADYRTCQVDARLAIALAERSNDLPLKLRAQLRLASAQGFLGDSAGGMALVRETLVAARSHRLRLIEALALSALTIIASICDDHVLALESSREKLTIDRELANPRNEATSLNNLGYSLLSLGEHVQARRYLEECLRLTRTVGDRFVETYPLNNLSVLALHLGEAPLAAEYARAALDIAVNVQNREGEAHGLCLLGNAELSLSHFEAAETAFERADRVATEIDNAERHAAVAGRARVALAQGRVETALEFVNRLLAHLAGGGSLEGTEAPQLVRLRCFEVLSAAGDPRAAEVLGVAHAELQAKANTISDPALRQSFLTRIPEHHDIAAAWQARAAPSNAARR